MSVINQKEYLRKYLGLGKKSGDKKKKKKTKKIAGNGLKIVDDDIDVNLNEEIKVDLTADNEDAPQIVSIIDDRPPSLRIDEKTKDHLWQPIGASDVSSSSITNLKFEGSFKLSKDVDGAKSLLKKKPSKNEGYSPARKIKMESSCDNNSPPRRTNKESSQPIKQNYDSSPPVRKIKREPPDNSPPRSHHQNSSPGKSPDNSPPRRQRKENTPPIIENDSSPPRKIKREKTPDNSPPRRRRRENSPPGKSPDNSPPRRHRKEHSPPIRKNDVSSPPRKIRRETTPDNSPPRRCRRESPPSGMSLDNSSRRKIKQEKNPDNSPPRRHRREKSPPKKSLDNSPPRRHRKDSSPPRRSKMANDSSPPRRVADSSPPRKNKKSRWADKEPEDGKLKKTLDGKTAGLQNAANLVLETRALKQREDELFKNMSADVSGANAATIVRSKKKKEVDWEEEERKKKREEENKEKYNKWGKGLKQVEDINEKIKSDLHEMSKPLARYADDEDLERHLKEQERDGDPMLAYIRQKRKKKHVDEGKPVTQEYQGDAPANRFGIRPGYRWDGVDRSSGYEKQWFQIQNSRQATVEETYKWSTEDM
ncbi:unnamed protein product [Ceutorhynchus assimilis]|uniref:BUD13 homolog n=1 Tax=Ceutorhynchus assimilis TaxID=467358 RepID=A0A9N9QQI2_9CUCU|nr:unnamed protein product [Ceutorhynchus assimilis]